MLAVLMLACSSGSSEPAPAPAPPPAPAPAPPKVVPPWTVSVSLSPAAAAKLAATGEEIHVDAAYYGLPRDGEGDEIEPVALATEGADRAGAGSVELGHVDIEQRALMKVANRAVKVNVNVYTARKKLPDNLLDCTTFDDAVTVAAKEPVAITCKLIGE
jgi:hypothetical protein